MGRRRGWGSCSARVLRCASCMPATRISATHSAHSAVVPVKAGTQFLLLPTWVAGNARNLFRTGARVTFFGAKKVTTASLATRTAKPARRASAEDASQETFKSNSNLPSATWSGFFYEASLSRRKTADLLSAALRVSRSDMGRWLGAGVGTMASVLGRISRSSRMALTDMVDGPDAL